MQEISAYKLIKEKLQAIPNLRHKGSLFEKISKQFLQEHDSANEYESIELWGDWKLRGKEGDRGIDIVIQTTSKEYIAVQCKFHQDSISLNDISTFLSQLQAGVGEVRFKKGIIISTSKLTRAALEEIEQIRSTGMGIDIDEITAPTKQKRLMLLKSIFLTLKTLEASSLWHAGPAKPTLL